MSAQRWLALALVCGSAFAGMPLTAAAQDEDLGEDDARAAETEAQAQGEDASEEEAAAPAPGGEAAATAEPASETTLRARAVVGAGVGTRWLRRPVVGGSQVLPTAVFPAADVGLSVRVWPDQPFSLDVLLHYQTSLGLTIQEQPIFALENEVDVRSERGELSVAPSFRLGADTQSARITVPAGMSLRNFWPAAHQLQTPRYVLWGPHVRAELDVPLGNIARFRFGPEAQMFFIAGTDLTNYGVHQPGFALGAEASLQLRVSDHFSIELQYRQSNALASAETQPSFLDVERYLTARLAGEM